MNDLRIIFTSLLVVFIVLKLTNLINWSWFYVLMPFYIPLTLGVVSLFILLVWEYYE